MFKEQDDLLTQTAAIGTLKSLELGRVVERLPYQIRTPDRTGWDRRRAGCSVGGIPAWLAEAWLRHRQGAKYGQ